MNSPARSAANAIRLSVGGLLASAIGIVIQIVSGVDYPTVPPGLIMLVVAAGLVALIRRPWVSVIGVLVPLFLFVGGIIASTGRHNLVDPANAGRFIGTLLQLVAVAVALGAGLVVLRTVVLTWRRDRGVRV